MDVCINHDFCTAPIDVRYAEVERTLSESTGTHLRHKVIAPRQCAPSIPNGQFATNTAYFLINTQSAASGSAKLGFVGLSIPCILKRSMRNWYGCCQKSAGHHKQARTNAPVFGWRPTWPLADR